jgi:hypothetical protein
MKPVKITIELELPIELSKNKKQFLVYNNSAFNQLVGTSAGSGNPHIYGAKKVGNKWELPVDSVSKRVWELERQIVSLQEKVIFMKKVLKQVKR